MSTATGPGCADQNLAMDGTVEVYRTPGAGGDASLTSHGPGQTVAPLAFPEVGFTVEEFFA